MSRKGPWPLLAVNINADTAYGPFVLFNSINWSRCFALDCDITMFKSSLPRLRCSLVF